MFFALDRYRAFAMSCSKGRGQPVIFWPFCMTLCRVFLSAPEQPPYHTIRQNVKTLSMEER